MFSIDLYKCTAPPNVVNKNLFFDSNTPYTINGEWYESSSILTPIFKLKRDTNDALLGYNYCWIAKFNRWYYINNIESDNPYLILYMQVDELETYKADIVGDNAPPQYVERQADINNINRNITDDMLPLEEEPIYDTKKWGTTPFYTGTNSTEIESIYCIALVVSNDLSIS